MPGPAGAPGRRIRRGRRIRLPRPSPACPPSAAPRPVKVIGQTGVQKGRRRRAADSTMLADAVATEDSVTQLVAAMRRVAREVLGAAGQIAAVCTGHDYSKPGKPKIDWDDSAAKDMLVSALVNDADALIAALAGAELAEPAASALALLALVAGQDEEPARGLTGGTGGGGSPARSPKTASSPP